MNALWKEYRQAIIFIIVFIGLYLLLNTVYGIFIAYYAPDTDPITYMVSNQVATVLSLFHEHVSAVQIAGQPKVPIQLGLVRVVNVYEGCNSINVMIVFTAFVAAFTSSWRRTIVFWLMGIGIIYIMNIVRVTLLFEVAYYYPDHLYLFHKYLFTGFIYAVVFYLWYVWIKRYRHGKRAASVSEE
jgi:exosortase family protein XrtF